MLDRIAWGGDAIGTLDDGRVIFVDSGFPGDRALVDVVQSAKRFARGKLASALEETTPRRAACPSADRCGGCRFQGLSYERELELKSGALEQMLRRIAPDVAWPALDVVPSPQPVGYRERVRLRVNAQGQTGYLARGSHELVPAITCEVLHPAIEAARPLAGRLSQGLPRVHQIRLEWDEERRVVVLEIPAEPETWDALNDTLKARASAELRPLVDASGEPFELAIALRHQGRWEAIVGDPHIYRRYGDVVVQQRSGNFSQAHRALNLKLRRRVAAWMREATGEGEQLVADLFGGAGNLAFALADAGFRVSCVDHASEALAAGELSDGERVVEQWLSVNLAEGPFEPIAALMARAKGLVLDPPRGGLSPNFVEFLRGTSADAAVHVSCDPPAFARDMSRLVTYGWRVQRLEAWDMFPRTPHLELVALLMKSG